MLLAGAGGALGPSSVQSAQSASVGCRVWVFPTLQTRHGWGRLLCQGLSLALCLQAERAVAPLLMQLREKFYFFWDCQSLELAHLEEGMSGSPLARVYHPSRGLGLQQTSNQRTCESLRSSRREGGEGQERDAPCFWEKDLK